VAGAQPGTLTDRLAAQRHDGVLIIDRERLGRIVHDRVVVVWPDVVAIGDVLIEIVLHVGDDVFPRDAHVLVPVLAALLVPEPHRVTDLVNALAHAASRTDRDHLLAALHADWRPAAVAHLEGNVIRIGGGVARRALHESDRGLLLPVANGGGDGVDQLRLDLIRDEGARPAIALAGDRDRECDVGPVMAAWGHVAGKPCRVRGRACALELLHRTDGDITLENSHAVDVGILNALDAECFDSGDEPGSLVGRASQFALADHRALLSIRTLVGIRSRGHAGFLGCLVSSLGRTLWLLHHQLPSFSSEWTSGSMPAEAGAPPGPALKIPGSGDHVRRLSRTPNADEIARGLVEISAAGAPSQGRAQRGARPRCFPWLQNQLTCQTAPVAGSCP